MNIVLNTNELGYYPFLNTNANAFIVGLKGFCVNQKYCLNINGLIKAISTIKDANKKIYVSLNLFAKEKEIKKLDKLMPKIKSLNADAYIISDLGVLNLFKKHNIERKTILDLHTYVTNKYSAKSLLNFGVKNISLSKEITLEDIKSILSFNPNKINLFAQGYVPITYSKRSILNLYYRKYKLRKNKKTHFIKEENRDKYYFMCQDKNCLTVYNDKQYSLFPYLLDLMQNNVNDLEINANFMREREIKDYIQLYSNGIEYISKNSLDEYNKLKEQFLNTHDVDNSFLQKGSFLLKEEK